MPVVELGWVAKDGRDAGDNDDRAAAGRYRFAVADGAATAARPEVWAEILVHAFVGAGVDPFDPLALANLRRLWHAEVHQSDLPWYATEKLRQGGAATFVGLEIDPAAGRFQACAVGDACLLHLSGTELVESGPIERWEQFDRFPALLTTTFDDEEHQVAVWRTGGGYQSGDVFILASDALAKYLLRSYEQGDPLDTTVFGEGFDSWVTTARQDGLDNDDTTVCVVRV